MIRYSLLCIESHAFETWFRDSNAFDDLSRGGHVTCPQCGSPDVRKALMAPAVRRAVKRAPAAEASPSAEPIGGEAGPVRPVDAPMALEGERSRQLRGLVREMHAKVKAHAENVGAAFPQEARRIHDGEEPQRPIYGTATGDEVRALIEDGIGIMPLPPLPDDRN